MAKRKPLNHSGIFFDSADLKEFKKWFATGILGGATTNPVILAKDNVYNISDHIAKMIKITGPNFPISLEIPDSEMSQKQMINFALKYHQKFPDNIVVKVPLDPRDPQKSFEIIYKLGQKGVPINATLGISAGQLIGAAEALRKSTAKGDNYVSLFWARREEAKMQIVEEIVTSGTDIEEALVTVHNAEETLTTVLNYLQAHNLPTRIIIGSIRSVEQIEQAFSLGADIATIKPQLLYEWMYTKRAEETVEEFNTAYREIKNLITLI